MFPYIHTHAAKLPQALVIRPTDSQQISTTIDLTYTSQQRTSDKHANHTSGPYKITTGTLRGGAGLPGEHDEFDHDMPAGDDFYDSTEVSAEDQALPGGSPGSVSSGYSSSSDLSAAASEHFHEQNELQRASDDAASTAGPSAHPFSAAFLNRPWHNGDYFSPSPRLGSPFQFENAPLTGSRNASRSHSMDILPYTGPPNDSTSSIQHTPYEGPSERRPLIGSHVPSGIPPPGYTYDGGEEDLPVAPQPQAEPETPARRRRRNRAVQVVGFDRWRAGFRAGFRAGLAEFGRSLLVLNRESGKDIRKKDK